MNSLCLNYKETGSKPVLFKTKVVLPRCLMLICWCIKEVMKRILIVDSSYCYSKNCTDNLYEVAGGFVIDAR